LFNIIPDKRRFLQEKNFLRAIYFFIPPGGKKQSHFRAMPALTGNGTQ
jgi:hypothetical protein